MAESELKDFFVSFNKADRAWAEWIAWTLEEAGYSVLFQHWDFTGNFVLEMDRAHQQTRRTIGVLSPDYLTSAFTAPEWAARVAQDGRSEHDLLIPVRVRECELSGLLAQIVYVDLIGADRSDARQRLLDRVSGSRLKPKEEPFFPGGPLPLASRTIHSQPRFPVAVNNLPPINPNFVGREGVLAELRRLLVANHGPAVLTQAITGLGGIGKTQTARAYAYRHLADYDLIWWLRAETSATLVADYVALARPLDFNPGTADHAELTTAIRQRLQAMRGWLLVFDNVVDPMVPRALLPSTDGGHTIITSRRTDWRDLVRALTLDVMPEKEALQVLTGHLNPQELAPAELAAARNIAADLGYLPLALSQAHAYMAETGKSLGGYLRLFLSSRSADFAANSPSHEYPASYATTWGISINAATAACPAARPLLELLAFLAPEPLPIEVLGANPTVLSEHLRSEHARDDAVAALRRYSLVSIEAGAITIHRLVQTVARDGLDELTTRALVHMAARLVQCALPDAPWEHTHWPAYQVITPHAIAVIDAAELIDTDPSIRIFIANRVGLYLKARGLFSSADELYRRALSTAEVHPGPQSSDLRGTLNIFGNLCRARGRYAEAEQHLRRALKIAEEASPPDWKSIPTLLSNLVQVYTSWGGRIKDAEACGKKAVLIGRRIARRSHLPYATWLNSLGSVYSKMDRPRRAEVLLRGAIAVAEDQPGPSGQQLDVFRNNLAELYVNYNRFSEAVPLLEQSISEGEKKLGANHYDLAARYSNLGSALANTGETLRAQRCLYRALEIDEHNFDPIHPEIATDLFKLAGFYSANECYLDAAQCAARSLSIRESHFPSGHPSISEVRAFISDLAGEHQN